MNKNGSHLHIFYKKLNYLIIALNLHHPLVTAKSNVCIFFIFRSSIIRVSPTDIISSLSLLRCRLSSSRRRHTVSHIFLGVLKNIQILLKIQTS
jgi:hypothetical protein